MSTFKLNDSLTPRQLCKKVANLVVCGATLVQFPGDGVLRTESCLEFSV